MTRKTPTSPLALVVSLGVSFGLVMVGCGRDSPEVSSAEPQSEVTAPRVPTGEAEAEENEPAPAPTGVAVTSALELRLEVTDYERSRDSYSATRTFTVADGKLGYEFRFSGYERHAPGAMQGMDPLGGHVGPQAVDAGHAEVPLTPAREAAVLAALEKHDLFVDFQPEVDPEMPERDYGAGIHYVLNVRSGERRGTLDIDTGDQPGAEPAPGSRAAAVDALGRELAVLFGEPPAGTDSP